MHNEASRATLEHEFGTSDDWEVIFHILEKGELQEGTVRNNLSLRLISSGTMSDQPLSHITQDLKTKQFSLR